MIARGSPTHPVDGRFGPFGGQYVPETLMSALQELEHEWHLAKADAQFQLELAGHRRAFIGRPTPLYSATRLSERFGGTHIHLKREDLCHTGAHKLNNAVGQALLALRMGKKRVIAETGAGQHGVATATVCARFGLDCTVYMGSEDIQRQAMNVRRMKLLGAEVVEVTAGTRTLKDATSEAIRDWVTNVRTTHYIIGSVVGPHPYPEMVRDLQRVIGDEAREQYLSIDGKLPDVVIACVGGGSNAIGIFTAFLDDKDVTLIGVEAAGEGIRTGRHAASLVGGRPGVLHGSYSYVLQDGDGQILPTHSVSAGLDYPGVGPEHSYLREIERVEYVAVTDDQALAAFRLCTQLEGIMPALEPAHALHHAGVVAKELGPGGRILVCLSGRGDTDMDSVESRTKPAAARGRRGRRCRMPPKAETRRLEASVRSTGDLKLVAYMMAGHPDPKRSVEIGKRLAASGVAALEIGIPFSDPLADGPVIQRAGQVALAGGMNVPRALELASAVTGAGAPVVLMTYINPVLAYDPRRFAADASQAGVAGVIVPDMPVEESEPVAGWLRSASLDTVFMVAPTTADDRLDAICDHSSGFVYCVTVTGITGMRKEMPEGMKELFTRVRKHTSLPVAAGFGMSRPEHMKALRGHVDAAVVGSAVVDRIERGEDPVILVKELLRACR